MLVLFHKDLYLLQRLIGLDRFAKLYARRLWLKDNLISIRNQGGSCLRTVTTLDGTRESKIDIHVID